LDTLDALSLEETGSVSAENPADPRQKKAPESKAEKENANSSATGKQLDPEPTAERVAADAGVEKRVEIDLEESREVAPPVSSPAEADPISPDVPEDRSPEAAADISLQFIDIEEDTQKDRYLSFRIAKEDYALEIKYVTEIIVMQRITEVPNTPSYIKGVINLRGRVIPVIDVRERFHLAARDYDDRTCIVVVSVSEIAVGLIVDTVNEVLDIPADMVDPPPAAYSGIESSYISGMGKVGRKVKILLDARNVLKLKE